MYSKTPVICCRDISGHIFAIEKWEINCSCTSHTSFICNMEADLPLLLINISTPFLLSSLKNATIEDYNVIFAIFNNATLAISKQMYLNGMHTYTEWCQISATHR